MITRVSQFRIDPADASEAERMARDRITPAVLAQAGVVAARWMLDAHTGAVMITVQWADGDAMLAAGAALARVRDEAIAALHATPLAPQVHETVGIAVVRPLAIDMPAWSRVVVLEGAGEARRADAAALFRILTDQHEGADGFLGAAWTADFGAGTSVIVSTWSSHDALRAGDTAGLWPEIARAMTARVDSSSERRTVGATFGDHVIDLTRFDRVATHLAR